jgi:phenylpropionate dioxygenase-like ring-hydroxylating dioxygenase large terminal subunit
MSNDEKISFKDYWYIACESKDLDNKKPIARKILDEWIVLFRDEKGDPSCFQDRCIHRNSQLSKGWVKDGKLQCSYHGWIFNGEGKLTNIPSEGVHQKKVGNRCAVSYDAVEQEGFIFIRLNNNQTNQTEPFKSPKYKEKGFETVRLFNKFNNSVINCAENYIDVPHTVFVHDKIFRDALDEEINCKVVRKEGMVEIEYLGETDNLGWFSWFLNPKKVPIVHIDSYHGPNITSVKYIIGAKEFWITSQSIPISEHETWVWTDLTYNFGHPIINKLSKPIVKFQGQSVIDQDIVVLDNQANVIKKYGENFSNATADVVHVLIESIYNSVKEGKDPKELAEKAVEVKFWI